MSDPLAYDMSQNESDSTRILAFDNVSTANGNVAARILANAGGTDTFSGIYLDTTNNRLYATVRKSPWRSSCS